MAENDTDELLEDDGSGDEDNSTAEKKGLSKPTIIKIAIGITVLLIVLGASYFFFTSEDTAPIPDSIPEESPPSPAETNNKNVDPDMAITLLEIREEAVTLREENLRLKQRIIELESQNQNDKKDETTTPEQVTKDGKKTSAIKQKAPDRKLKTNQYIVNYQDDINDYPSRYKATNSEPAPKPKWGEFDPLYNGK